MSALVSPYNAGHARDETLWCRRRCACCRLAFEYEAARDAVEVREHCEPCQPHHEIDGEPVERRVARLADHETRLRRWAEGAVLAVMQSQHEAQAAQGRARAEGDARDRWRDLAVEMYRMHRNCRGTCACGLPWPCPTVQVALGRGGITAR